jgi:hypothetical protein
MHSNEVSTPPDVSSFTAATGSPSEAIHGVARAELARELELPRHGVDRDDPPAPAIRAPWSAESPTPPQPITATLLPGAIFAVLSAAPTPCDTAADQRRLLERHVVADLHERVLVQEHLLGEAREVRELVDRGAALRDPRRLAGLAHRGHAAAQVRAAGEAVVARAAEHRQARDHVIAGER